MGARNAASHASFSPPDPAPHIHPKQGGTIRSLPLESPIQPNGSIWLDRALTHKAGLHARRTSGSWTWPHSARRGRSDSRGSRSLMPAFRPTRESGPVPDRPRLCRSLYRGPTRRPFRRPAWSMASCTMPFLLASLRISSSLFSAASDRPFGSAAATRTEVNAPGMIVASP